MFLSLKTLVKKTNIIAIKSVKHNFYYFSEGNLDEVNQPKKKKRKKKSSIPKVAVEDATK